MLRLLLILWVFMYGELKTEAILTVDYGHFKFKVKDTVPNVNPNSLAASSDVLTCSVRCSLDQSCMAFYYGNSQCAILYSRITDLKESPGYTYYHNYDCGKSDACSACPNGKQDKIYIHGNASYMMCASTLSWTKASEACCCAGGRLVNIFNKKDQDFFEELMGQYFTATTGGTCVWIGLNGNVNGGKTAYTLERSNGEAVTKGKFYGKWQSGYPMSTKESGVCIRPIKDVNLGYWYDLAVTASFYYACEFTN